MKDRCESILRGARLRVTAGRRALVHALIEHAEPVSLEDAVRLCGREGGDPATIYRNLKSLLDARVLRAIRGVGRRGMYELAIEHHTHAHVSCTNCGKVECLEIPELPQPPLPPQGWRLDELSLTAWGLCPACGAR